MSCCFRNRWVPLAASAVLFCLPACAFAQSRAPEASGDAHASRALEEARKQGPLALYAFLKQMPKGADLHNHLAGAVYAESFIREAAEQNLCVNAKTLTLYKANGSTRNNPPPPVCGEEGEPVASAFANQQLFDQIIDTFS